ncbi:MAG TPA: SNF2-related protein, partial [Opitutaceae bacterium]|nr:SNF2-related protein [Opitutaceae bacterium]
MSLAAVGQRCISEREPELGLGIVARLDTAHIAVEFPASGEKRTYARNTPVLKRVQLRAGECATTRQGTRFTVETVAEENDLLIYSGAGQRVREDQLSDNAAAALPTARLLSGQGDESALFDLRLRALQAQAALRQSPLRGFLGGRIDLIPHQLYILHEVASRPVPRVLLADEVGLGKTIEACLIVQRLLAVGRAQRVLVLVPETLVHQWFVELLRRFNLWFSILDEERCAAAEASEPDGNPFLGQQLTLCSTAFLAGNSAHGEQAVAAGWDVVVVDEAH